MINYFNFKEMNGKILLTNDFGRHLLVNKEDFIQLIKTQDVCDVELRKLLIENYFLFDTSVETFTYNSRMAMVESKNYLYRSTQLFIFVVTTACNLQCKYCQAQNGETIANGYMTKEVAMAAVDIALQSPAQNLSFEFQGGEPLLNFEIIKYIVEYASSVCGEKHISYSVVSNLTMMTEEILDFFCHYNVGLSTSLDGDEILHNSNRPYRSGKGSFSDACEKINNVRKRDIWVGAIQTTTRESLSRYQEIVDTYVELGFESVSLRPLTPLGCANKAWSHIGYSPAEFVDFYKKALHYIIELNKNGRFFIEGIAKILLTKVFDGYGMNYMELRSPCGAAIGQIAFYYDGNIYTCDEGRMIAEMGNHSFRLGSINDSYDSLMDSNVCRGMCQASILEGLPSCSDCVYQPFCGVCPAVNYTLFGDLYETIPHNYKCEINKGILDTLFEIIDGDKTGVEIMKSWIR